MNCEFLPKDVVKALKESEEFFNAVKNFHQAEICRWAYETIEHLSSPQTSTERE